MKSWFTFTMLLASLTLQAKNTEIQSVHTSILQQDCLITASAEWEEVYEIDFLSMLCPSYGGYQVEISGGDIRYNLKLHFEGKNLPTENMPNFQDLLGDKIEWRYKLPAANKFQAKPKFTALIYGLAFQDYDDQKEDFFENYKVVAIRLEGKKSCIVAKIEGDTVKSEEDAYAQARSLVDNPQSPCLE